MKFLSDSFLNRSPAPQSRKFAKQTICLHIKHCKNDKRKIEMKCSIFFSTFKIVKVEVTIHYLTPSQRPSTGVETSSLVFGFKGNYGI